MRPCSVPDCDRKHSRHGFCEMHAKRHARHNDVNRAIKPMEIRLMEKVNKNAATGCWEWTGTTTKFGYGMLGGSSPLWRKMAHRISFELFKGAIPEGLFVLHYCDNPPCVNPDHLFVGTTRDNVLDKERKGRGNHPRGNDLPISKLNPDAVREIRASYRRGVYGYGIPSMAKRFRVDEKSIRMLLAGKTWRHV